MTGGIFAILDDIAMLMDDTAAVTKIAIKKTVPILGDDLAVGAEQASGFHASRELPVLWAIVKGSFKNKLIVLPIIFLLNFFASWLIPYILVLGGLYLAYEGGEKVYEVIESKVFKKVHHSTKKVLDEKAKIKSAIFTDFILSIEITVMALSAVMDETFMMQVISVSAVAMLVVVGVYGSVAMLVRMDDVGYYIIEHSKEESMKEKFGKLMVQSLPKIIKFLAIVGTIAMLMVAGGILVHNVSFIHHFYEAFFVVIPSLLFDMFFGGVVGLVLFGFVKFISLKIIKQ